MNKILKRGKKRDKFVFASKSHKSNVNYFKLKSFTFILVYKNQNTILSKSAHQRKASTIEKKKSLLQTENDADSDRYKSSIRQPYPPLHNHDVREHCGEEGVKNSNEK